MGGRCFMQNEIVAPQQLLNNKGNIENPGYAKKMHYEYNRKSVKASKLRLKEWDYYLVYNNDYAVALTVADNGYMGMLSVSLINFNEPSETTKSKMTFMPLGKFKMPSTSVVGDVNYSSKNVKTTFLIENGYRKLHYYCKNFKDKQDLSVDFILTEEPQESMVIATPFSKPKHFYYNQKIVGFKAQGRVTLGKTVIEFSPNNTQAILDWGRGVWTYKNTWYWGAGCGVVNGNKFGFNIGYGFGDTSKATENMLFYNGKAHKLNDVTFNIPKTGKKYEYTKDWTFTSSDGRFEMHFKPLIDRYSNANVLVIQSLQHQVFGKFTGTAILDDGTKVQIKDFLGFAERVANRW